MKRLLILSLLLNLVLLGVAAWRPRRVAPMPRSPRAEVVRSAARPTGARVTSIVPKQAAEATPWQGIESADTAQLIANLRALGCPEKTIRDLVVSRVCRAYQNRALAAEAEVARSLDVTKGRSQREWRESNRQRAQLRDEMKNELEDLLGQSAGQLTLDLLGWPELGGREFLPLEKRRQVRDITRRYNEQTEDLQSGKVVYGLDAEDRARLKDLGQQRDAELAAALSPQEKEEWLCRESAVANHVRQHLPPAQSEAEYRQIVRLAAEFDLAEQPTSFTFRYAQPGAEDDPAVKEYEQRKAAFDQRLKEVFGEDRLAEQAAEEKAREERERQAEEQRQEHQARAEFAGLAQSVGVDEAAANRFYERMKELQPQLQPRFDELEKSLGGTPEEKKKQMEAAITAELEQHAVEIMGEKGRDFIQKLKEHDGRH